MTNSEKVREFAETATKSHLPDGSFLPPLPSTAIPMDKESVKNIVKMVLDECVEILVTVTTSENERKEILEDIINNIKFRKDLDSSWKSVDKIVEELKDFKYEDKIAQSKLVQHLLLFENLEINFLTQEIRLNYREI